MAATAFRTSSNPCEPKSTRLKCPILRKYIKIRYRSLLRALLKTQTLDVVERLKEICCRDGLNVNAMAIFCVVADKVHDFGTLGLCMYMGPDGLSVRAAERTRVPADLQSQFMASMKLGYLLFVALHD